jgi:hypothetical protein
VVQKLIVAGANVEEQNGVRLRMNDKLYPLYITVTVIEPQFGYTALSHAAIYGSAITAKVLLEAKAQVNHKTKVCCAHRIRGAVHP